MDDSELDEDDKVFEKGAAKVVVDEVHMAIVCVAHCYFPIASKAAQFVHLLFVVADVFGVCKGRYDRLRRRIDPKLLCSG